MLSKLSFLLVCMLFTIATYSQSVIKGSVADTSSSANLRMAVISLLRSKDSVLVKFTRADEKGNFELSTAAQGKHILMVSFPNFADYVEEIELKPSENINKNIFIIPKSKLLEEIIIQQKVSAIRIKGDTTEFKADSFKVGPNANVQDLLRKLPGLQVNSKGEITAQGQKVEKVLVDGEEFFSDDPAVVTQNLRADFVDKVQVFDKKSEQATFTGVDDGQKTKTINLELKDDKKKGYFGKIEAGTDFNQYRNAKGLINSFKKKRKVAGFIINNNTTFQGLNWQERQNFGANDMTSGMTNDGGMYFVSERDDFSSGDGLPNSTSAGLTYINKWNKDKNSLNANAQFNDQTVNGLNTSLTQTILPDTSFSNRTNERFETYRNRKRISGTYDWTIDSTSSLKFKAAGSLVNTIRNNNFNGQSFNERNQLFNQTDRTTTDDIESRDFTSELNYKKKLQKQGRTISYTGNFSNNNRDGDGFLFAANSFFDPSGTLLQQQNFDQKKTNVERKTIIQNSFVYTEPLSKTIFLEVSYRNAFNRNNAQLNTLEKLNNNDKYTELVDTLSNHFLFNTSDHSGGFNVRYAGKKFSVTAGTNVGRTVFKAEELRKQTEQIRGFTNLLPRVNLRFTPKKQKSINISYNGSPQNPTLQQINPIINNIDPLNITIGNPDLRQAFNHRFNVNFSDYKVFKSRNIYFSGSFNVVNNAITNSNFIDNFGRRINQTINTDGNYNGNFWSMYGFEVAKSVNLRFNAEGSMSRFVNVVNNIQNISNNYTTSLGIGIGVYNDKWINFNLDFSPDYNISRSSINKDLAIRYWSFTSYPYVEMKFKKAKLFVDVNGQFTVFQQTAAFPNQRNVFLINGNIRRTFTKKDALELKLSVNDLLNQNIGIRRNITSNFISENTFQNLRRFFLLSVIWNFNKNGAQPNQ
jgi:Outer membrane protein beta-barrel family/CarboxypepD_reg-like domain